MTGVIGHYCGITIYKSIHATINQQFRSPRSKKKRIRKKFAKNPDNFKLVPTSYLMNGDKLIAHPEICMELRAKIDREASSIFY